MRKLTLLALVFILAVLAVLGIALAFARASVAAPESTAGDTYYVDYDGGGDGNDGLSEGTAWKHAPGDPEATGAPASVDLQPGDTVLFKGGVTYRGYIYLLRVNGTMTEPITYKGDGWGEGRAIIEGSQPITTGWTRCESQAACDGNPHWQSIYYTDAPAGVDFTQGFFEDDAFIWQAQDPNPDDPFYYDRIDGFRVISHTDPTVYQTRTSITDPRYFTQTDSSAWDGAYVAVWRIPNVTVIKKVTGFDPGTDTIYHEDLGGDIYTDRNTFYAVLNHLRLLDLPGEYVLDESTGRFYVWPLNSDHPDQHTYSVLEHGTGIYGIECNHLVIEGFDVTKFRMGIRAIREPTSHVAIRNNRISLLRSNNWYALQVSGEDMLVEGNVVTDCQRAVGILAGGNRVTVRNNFVSRTSRQGIWFMGIENSEILDNRITDIRGTHSNGISVYLHHQNILMAGNRVWNTNIAMTYHGDHDPDFVNNLIVHNNFFANDVHSWGKGMRGVTILNNTFLEGIFFPSEDQEVVFINNVVNAGGGGHVRSHNVYIGLTWSQQPRYGWAPGPGEIVGWDPVEERYIPIDPKTVLVDPEGDYQLQPDGPAVDGGTDASAYLPEPGEFSYTGFGSDIDGIPRPYGATWDMGASEFVPDLDLSGQPGNKRIYLDWTVNATDTLPVSTTWHIDYYTQTTTIFSETGIVSPTRAYTLTDLANYHWYTVTLHAMDGTALVLSDTVRVMPTNRFVYLPLVLRTHGTSVHNEGAFAAQGTHYVRAGATGNNDGTDWINAWTELPETLERGHTYYVADGVYPSYRFDDAESGADTIYVLKATQSEHGTNVGWTDSYGDGQADFAAEINFITGYWVWDGVTGSGSDVSSYGFRVVETRGCDQLESMGQIQRMVGMPPVGYANNTVSHITFSHTAVSACGDSYSNCQIGIYSNPGSALSMTVSHNYLSDATANLATRHWHDSVIEFNTFERNWSSPSCHGEHVSPGGGETNVTYRYNTFKDGAVFVLGIHGIVGNPPSPKARNSYNVYGNVVIGGVYTGIFAVSDSAHQDVVVDSYFHNNTIVGASCGGYGVVGVQLLSDPENDKSFAYNNLIFDSSKVNFHGHVDYDYTAIYSSTLAWFLSEEDLAAHDVMTDGNPFVGSTEGDFHLAFPTDPGVSLAAPFDVDVDGHARGADGVWDRGAYEFVPDLVLRGRPGDKRIYLDWTVNATDTLPVSTAWHIDYYTQTTTVFSETGIVSPTRAYTLTDLANYHWYTVTLHAMMGETAWLSDTVRVMPTDKFVYLPLVLREW